MSQRSVSVRQFANQHLGLLITATALIFVMMRLLVVTRGSVPVALALLQSGGTANIVVGSILRDAVLTVANLALVGALVWLLYRMLFGGGIGAPLASLAVATFLASFFYSLRFFVITAVMWVFSYFNLRALRRSRSRDESPMRYTSGFWVILAIVGVLQLSNVLLTTSPWVPLEALVQGSGRKAVGYVVARDGADVVVLEDETRLILRIEATNIRERYLCAKRQTSAAWWARQPVAFAVLREAQPRLRKC